MSSTNPLDSVFFIALPEDYSLPENAFKIDTTIPLPVQSTVKNAEEFDMNTLSWEMILAGILAILAYDINNPHIHYYRSLINSVKPNLKTELTQAAILKINFFIPKKILLCRQYLCIRSVTLIKSFPQTKKYPFPPFFMKKCGEMNT